MEGFLNLAWLVPIPPFLAFLAIVLFLNKNKTISAYTAIGGAVISWLLGWSIAFAAFTAEHFGEHPHYGELFTIPTGSTNIVVGYQVDPANALMLFMASFLLLMIFIYASGYMSFPAHLSKEHYPAAYAQGKDPRYSRFMAYISLFATGMLGLVVSNSLITFFVFWEIMGLCSYLLIGFWYEKKSAQAASIKAFMTTRVGDAHQRRQIRTTLHVVGEEPGSTLPPQLRSPVVQHDRRHRVPPSRSKASAKPRPAWKARER